MLLRVLLLVGSVALNGVCLAAFVMRPTMAPAPVRDFFVRHFQRAATPAPVVAKSAPAKTPARKLLWPELESGDDLSTLVSRLRRAGFPAEIIRAMVLMELSTRYDAKLRGFFEPDPTAPFWKAGSGFITSGDKRMEQYSQLLRERAKLQRDLLADPIFASDDVTAGQRRQFGNLSRQKIDLVQRIEDDYAEMMAAIRSATNGILLTEDREKLALLQRERRADLMGVLSPQELADYEMRSSPITSMLSRYLTTFNATEAEFRAIFQAQMAYSEKAAPTGSMAATNYQDRQAAQQQMNESLRAALGEARYADYMRETDRSYQQLVRLAQRENIPMETAVRAFNVRDGVAQESGRIVDDAALTVDQKRAALQALAERTRNQVLGLLGPTAGPTYVQVIDQQWLKMVERGNAVSFNGNTGSMTYSMGASGPSGMPIMISFGGGVSYRNVNQPVPRP